MSKEQNTFSGQIGKAIAECGRTRYAIHKTTGLSQSMLSRLVSGDGWIGREAMDALAAELGLSVVVTKTTETPAEAPHKPKTACRKAAPRRR